MHTGRTIQDPQKDTGWVAGWGQERSSKIRVMLTENDWAVWSRFKMRKGALPEARTRLAQRARVAKISTFRAQNQFLWPPKCFAYVFKERVCGMCGYTLARSDLAVHGRPDPVSYTHLRAHET